MVLHPHGGIAPGIDRIVMLLANRKEYQGSNDVSNESKCYGSYDECSIRCK